MALAAALLASLAPASRAEVSTLGHSEIGVVYNPADPQAFELEAHVEQNGIVDGQTITNAAGQAYAPASLAIQVPLSANLQ